MDIPVELLIRVLCDTLPRKDVDAAYLFCTTRDNQASVFRAAGELTKQSTVSRFLLLDAGPISGYPGFDSSRKGLEAEGIFGEKIHGVPSHGARRIHTRIESEAMVRYAKARDFRSMVVISPPFHQLRAYMTAASVALQEHPDLAIYSRQGAAQPWMENVTHSQGTLTAPRRQLIQEEITRIGTYQQKGDLENFEAVLNYMNRRDA